MASVLLYILRNRPAFHSTHARGCGASETPALKRTQHINGPVSDAGWSGRLQASGGRLCAPWGSGAPAWWGWPDKGTSVGSMFAVGQAWPEPLGSFKETAACKRGIPQRRRRWDVPHVRGRAAASSTGRSPLPLVVVRRRAGRRAGRRSPEDRVVLLHQPFTPWGRVERCPCTAAPSMPMRPP